MIYFVRANNRVKIGYADDPSSRIPSIQTSSPYKLEVLLIIEGTYEIEHKIHKRFQEYRIIGEWFEYGPRLEAYLLNNQAKDRKFEFGFIIGDFSDSEQVLRLRKRHNLTLAELGEKLKVTGQSVKEIQNREKSGSVSIHIMRTVAEALGYKFEYRFTPINVE